MVAAVATRTPDRNSVDLRSPIAACAPIWLETLVAAVDAARQE
jgi:hypothetical protein